MLQSTVALIVCAFALLYVYLYQVSWKFWQKLGVRTHPAIKFPLAHLPNPFSLNFTNLGVTLAKPYYEYFKNLNVPFGGLYLVTTPIFMPMDLDLIKQILIRDFDYFDQKGLFFNEERQLVTAHLFQIGGQRWKKLRVKLTPTFTSGKMKMMFPSIIKCTGPMMQQLTSSQQRCVIDVKDLCGKFTTDVIGSCAFGIECNSFENTDFHTYATRTFETGLKRGAERAILQFLPTLGKSLGLVAFPMEVSNFFERITKETVEMRKTENIKRNDFIQLLMELHEKEGTGNGITMQEVLAQAFLFFNAGYETSASTMTYCLYELAQHLDIQQKAREEILKVFEDNDGVLTYQCLGDLKYLQQVIEEALRLHPPVPVINRESSRDYTIPNTNICLPKGTKVFIACLGIHYDEDYYPDPERFDPDRFSEENKQARHNCAFLAFGDGPRLCIGARFAYMQVKVGLAYMLKEHRFTMTPETPKPLNYGPGLVLSSRDAIKLNCEKI